MNRSLTAQSIVIRLLIFAMMVIAIPFTSRSQSLPEPVREQLLNRLSVLFIQRNSDPNVLLKLRVNSGAAFDLAGRGGTMALLGDIFFPDPSTREYVAEQMGGRLEVKTDYDAIDITISGKATEFERMVDFLRGALVTTQISPENVTQARAARLKQMASAPSSAAQIADDAIAARLFGRFPYGHPPGGTLESVSKVDRADLLLARERFLNPDTSTLVVIGGIEKGRAMRALRQLLGQWRKGDAVVPPTFRPPDPPDARVLIVNQAGSANAEVRVAVRGLARADRDYAAAVVLALIAGDRWRAAMPETSSGVVHHQTQALPGMFVIGASVSSASASKAIASARDLMSALAIAAPSPAEIERARSAALAELSQQSVQTEPIADFWLDHERYSLPPYSDQLNALRAVTAADVQRVAARLFQDAHVASVAVGNSDQLKANLGSTAELYLESSPKAVPISVKPASKP